MTDSGYPASWCTFRELDEAEGRPKGSAFRCFKRLNETWMEGRDFVLLPTQQHTEEIRRLKEAGRLYGSTVNAVLLAPHAARSIRDALRGQTDR
jgi:hypothetical protein